MSHDNIIEAAKVAHKTYWKSTTDEGTGDKLASTVTKAWQKSIISNDIRCEVKIAMDLNERIDVIDSKSATAFEMKVSGKNPHHEFYKDIFKVIIYNENNCIMIKRLVFLTEKSGADKLLKGLGKSVTDHFKNKLPVEIVAI